MKRRGLLTLLGGGAAWPLAAHAQQAAMPGIGFLHSQSPDTNADRLRGFHRGLKDSGYVEGENLTIVYRWAENQIDRLPALAVDLVRPRWRPRRSPLSSSPPKTRLSLVLSPASPGRAATSQVSIFSVVRWWQSGWNSCAIWCRQPLAWPCSSIRQMPPIPRPP